MVKFMTDQGGSEIPLPIPMSFDCIAHLFFLRNLLSYAHALSIGIIPQLEKFQ